MVSCVNISSQEFKHLLMVSKLPSKVLEAKVSLWQQEHGLESYPTLEDLKNISEVKSEVKEEPLKEVKPTNEYFEQIVQLKRSIGRVESKVKQAEFGSPEYKKFKEMEVSMKDALAKYEATKNKAYLYELAEIELNNIEGLIRAYETGSREASNSTIAELLDKLDSLYNLPEIAERVANLKKRYTAVMQHVIENLVEEKSNIKEGKSFEELNQDKEDIGGFTTYVGALINVKNKIANTIGKLIKETQIKISGLQGSLYEGVKSETKKLEEYASANGLSMKEVYDIFIQDANDTTVLTRPYKTEFYTKLNAALKARDRSHLKFAVYNETSGKFEPINKELYINPNYTKIQNTKELKTFYDFYKKTIQESLERLPTNHQTEWLKKHPEDFIPNIFTESLSDILKAEGFGNKMKGLAKYITGMKVYEISEKDFIKDESLERDIIPVKYINKLTGENKSRDLGEALFKFAAMSIEHEQLSEILPQTRLLQRSIADNKFINPNKSGVQVDGDKSNLYKLIDGFIEMQVLGKKTKGKDEITIGKTYDSEGNVTGKKIIKGGELADFGLKWNSLLRIGLNPITAVTNALVGEAGNITEAFGGRFFNNSDLTKASGIFFGQIFDKESKVNKLIEKYPLLQELTDYEYASNLSIHKGLTGEKLKNYMYAPQKAGEVFLQTRTMVAMMLHTKPDGKTSLWEMLDDKGEIKEEFLKHFGNKSEFDQYMLRTSTKIMGVNEQIHGRYSSRDAAIINQNVWLRMAFQFKKWIPAAIESRFGSFQYNDRLMVETEGRWRTIGKMIINLKNTADRISKGELKEYEIYNFRKTATEAVLLLGTLMMGLWMDWDDDEKRQRSASFKFTMDQLDKVSGDLLFMANPKNVTAMTKNPFAITKLVNSVWDVARYIPYTAYVGEYKYKSGAHKGENKFYYTLGSVIPGYNQLQNVQTFFNDQKYIERQK